MARTFEALDGDVVEMKVATQPGLTTPTRDPEQHRAAVAAVKLLIATLSQKTLAALSSLVTGAALFSAWWLWTSILSEPTVNQLVGVSLYALFLLAIEYIRRRI